MPVQKTIFNRMTQQDEDDTSELLVNMMQTRFLRDICLEWLLSDIPYKNIKNIVNSVKVDHIVTQCSYGNYGRPDIKIDNKDCFFLIENKIHIGTDLQENQISNYIDIIKNNNFDKKISGLIFLIPKGYNYENYLTVLKQEQDNKIETQDNGINISIKYWNDFLDFLYNKQINNVSTLYEDSLEYLKSTIDLSIVENTTLDSMETAMLFSSGQISAVYSLADKVKKLCKNFVDNLNQTKFSYDSENNNIWGIGITFKRNQTGLNNYFLGLSPSLCNKDNKIPEKFSFSMCFWSYKSVDNSDDVLCCEDTSEKKTYYWIYMPLNKMILAETDQDKQQEMFNENAKEVLDRLCKIEDKLLL